MGLSSFYFDNKDKAKTVRFCSNFLWLWAMEVRHLGQWFSRFRPWLMMGQSLLLGCWLGCCWLPSGAIAATLQERVEQYPHWSGFPPVVTVHPGEDLVYPQWMAGTWLVTSTLKDQIAPLAPEIVTPGFEQNRALIDQSLQFLVKFGSRQRFLPQAFTPPRLMSGEVPIVANREFNGTEIALAYLGKHGLQSVRVDPANPNRQLTILQGDRRLISTITDRATESPTPQEFISSEITQQQFQGSPQLYLNTVETTTDYVRRSPKQITANQITAIYLSPNDPNFFQARNQPVALYRYDLRLDKQPE